MDNFLQNGTDASDITVAYQNLPVSPKVSTLNACLYLRSYCTAGALSSDFYLIQKRCSQRKPAYFLSGLMETSSLTTWSIRNEENDNSIKRTFDLEQQHGIEC